MVQSQHIVTLGKLRAGGCRQVVKAKKAKKAEPAVEVKLPDLSGIHFELPAMVRRREETPISSGDDIKQQVLAVQVVGATWLQSYGTHTVAQGVVTAEDIALIKLLKAMCLST